MSDFDLPALEMEARLKDHISENLETINKNIQDFGEKSQEHFNEASRASGQTEDAFDKLTNTVKGLVGAYIGIEGAKKAFDLMDHAVDIAQSQVLAQTQLKEALGGDTKALEDQAEALQNKVLIDHIDIEQADARLANYVKDADAVKKLMPAIIDLAKAKKMDLASAADLVGRTIDSETGTMGRLQIKLEGLPNSMDRVDSAVKELTKKFGGQAEALAKVDNGTEHLKIAWNDFFEQVGNKLNPLWTKFKELTAGMLEFAANNMKSAKVTEDEWRASLESAQKSIIGLDQNSEMYKRLSATIQIATEHLKEFHHENDMVGPPKPAPHISHHGTPKESGDTKEPNEGFTSGVVDTGAAEMKAEIKKSEEIEKILKERVEANKKNDEDIERQNERATIEQIEADKKYYEEVKEGNDKLIEEYQQHIKKMGEVADNLGETFGKEIGKGLASGKMNMKQAMKDLLDQIVEFIEKEELAAIASNTLQNVETYGYWGIAIGAAEAAGIAALGEAAKGAINSFSAGTSNAPGGFARVHQDETIFLPAHSVVNTKTESKNTNNNETHFHFYGNTDSTTVDTIQSMLIEANRTGRLEQFKAKLK